MNRKRFGDSDYADNAHHKKRRTDAVEIEDRLESLIIRVGEKSNSSLESNLEGLASVLDADVASYKNKILKILCDCAVKMPEKTTIYTTLIGLLNAKNYIFGGEFVDLMARKLKEALKACMWKSARYMVRFFADLVNCHVISTSSLMELYQAFLDTARDDKAPQVRSDTYVYAVLSSLPWVGRELFEKKDQDLDRLLKTIEIYVAKRSRKHVHGLRVWRADDPHPQEEYLDCLWAQICKLRADQWQEKHIARPYVAFDNVLCEALQHNIPAILPPSHHPDNTYPFPWVVFRLFDYTDCPESQHITLPGAHSIERYLIEEHLHNIIKEFHLERKPCASFLLDFPLKHKIPLEYVIVEVVLAELFHLPNSRYLEICYGSLLIELCKLQSTTMPQVLAQAVELLYERIDTMNTCCHDRFVRWFAYHLSNFQFKWSWDDWIGAATLDPMHPKARFISEVLERCMRLSYHKRIAEVVPEQLDALVPAEPRIAFRFHPDSATPEAPGWETAQQLLTTIRQRAGPEEVLQVLEGLHNTMRDELAGDELTPAHNDLQIQVFVQTLLYLGSKSISHSFAGITKFLKVFESLVVGGGDPQQAVLKEVFEAWKGHHQMIVVLVDKLLRTQVVQCATIANWVFSDDMKTDFHKAYVWELLHNTVAKMGKHVTRLQKDMSDARDARRRYPRRGAGGGQAGAGGSDESDGASEASDEETQRPRPSEDDLERMEEKLDAALADQKNLFLIIFQRFIMLLSKHMDSCEQAGVSHDTHWFRATVGRLQQVFMLHNQQVERYNERFTTLLFTDELHSTVLDVFRQFVALRC